MSGYFDLAEINAMEHKPMYMSDYVEQLDALLKTGGRGVLEGAGTLSHKQALEKAKKEYRKFQNNTISPVEQEYLKSLKQITKKKSITAKD